MVNKHRLSVALMVLGYVSLIYGTLADGTVSGSDVRALALGVIVCSVTYFFTTRERIDEHAIYEHGHQAGYDAGYLDGRRVAKPVIVPLHRVDLSLSGTTSELRQVRADAAEHVTP